MPLTARDRSALVDQARALAALRPDCIEWRADFVADLVPADVPVLLRDMAAAAPVPLIVTNRLAAEGGHRVQDEDHRVAILTAAAATGIPALVDLELATAPPLAERVAAAAGQAGVAVIRSWHDFSATPPVPTLLGTLRTMQSAGAAVAKVAVTPRTPEDVLALLTAGLEARRTFLEIPCILMSMGALGAVSRFAGHFGSDLTFAVGLEASAPGQMDLELTRRGLQALGLAGDSGEERP
ncbi:MAG: type I 3-dehydroquinate dehydratase [Armatimonadota bacterium]|nr:type I 3-dehydroquinate dehydratase [Armatimonadota bacterium]MDR7465919.1 type I 3-dehydroquinate dehydratase [Armatimonadota bacterium]MDR7493984.1 type I 3-dehydroquinate dehydratase [Armatimonadota bacterium]MDR7504149.1 type I 3-dehydroquinate dehydratase [Armatimonadota bacterium]MDR7546348.1 type I 3-dehydroquinate dehydratase [Armatimonadota bacterium]